MSGDYLKEMARQYALEYMVMLLGAKIHQLNGYSLEQVKKIHEGQRQMLAAELFPLSDPVQSDHFAAEVQAAVESLLAGIEELMAKGERPK